MRALGELIGSGFAADHAFVLSAMFFDWRALRAANAKDFDLLAELRLRGFARAIPIGCGLSSMRSIIWRRRRGVPAAYAAAIFS